MNSHSSLFNSFNIPSGVITFTLSKYLINALEWNETFIIIPPPIVPGISIISSKPFNDNRQSSIAKVFINIPPPTWTK